MNFFKKLLSWVTSIIIAIVLLSLLVSYVPPLFGMTPSTVMSNSMEPDYSRGSIIFAAEATAEEIDYGDIISFYYGNNEEVVSNKVVDINSDERYYIVEENNREQVDSQKQVPFNSVIGKVRFYMPFIGYVSMALKTMSGKIALAVVIVLAIISFLIPEKKRRLRNDDYEFY